MNKILYILIGFLFLSACDKSGTDLNGQNSDGGTGRGGSLARFTIAKDYLYVVDDQKLYTYSLANSAAPEIKSTQQIGSDIETIYSYGDYLFVGSQSAMYVYSISDAAHPSGVGTAPHVRSCDPVVARGNWAYVTLRNGSTCGGSQSALMVYDVSDITFPLLVRTITMGSPYGLGIRNNKLYVTDGSNGLNVYDISTPSDPKFLKHFSDDVFYDVIPTDDLLICMVQGGTALYQYDNAQELVRMAKISN